MEFHVINALDPLYQRNGEGGDVWTEDFMEFGSTSIAAPEGGIHGMHAVMRSPNQDRPATNVTTNELLGPAMGYVWPRATPTPRCSRSSTRSRSRGP
jgi:hypothetical protein